MINYIVGGKGVGKTKLLVESANEQIKKENGNIMFIDVDHEHIFNLDFNVRLINALEFKIDNIDKLYGFLLGIISRDYDIEIIYVDSIYKLIDIDIEDMKYLRDELSKLKEKYNFTVYLNVDYPMEDLPKELQKISYDAGKIITIG